MLLFHCRAGSEADCGSELTARALAARTDGHAEYESGTAYVLWLEEEAAGRRRGGWTPDFADLVFARQMLTHCRRIALPDAGTRIEAIVAAAAARAAVEHD